MNKLVITLAENDLVELQAILMDDDERAALEFLRTRLAARIPKKGTAPCDSSRLNPFLLKPNSKNSRQDRSS